MDTAVWVTILVVLAIVALAALAGMWMMQQRRRTNELRESFGPEYDRAVENEGGRRGAESELDARRKRVEALNIHELSREDRERFSQEWQTVQARFVDDPGAAIGEADSLIGEVMQTRGYPVGDFEQRAADISVDHPRVVSNYREAHDIAVMQGRGEADTEDLRQAMICYRELFSDLVQSPKMRRAV
jgi:hypothetical protein